MADDNDDQLLFYDAKGKRVSEDSDKAVRQFLSSDPARPDFKAKKSPDEDKSVKSPDEDK